MSIISCCLTSDWKSWRRSKSVGALPDPRVMKGLSWICWTTVPWILHGMKCIPTSENSVKWLWLSISSFQIWIRRSAWRRLSWSQMNHQPSVLLRQNSTRYHRIIGSSRPQWCLWVGTEIVKREINARVEVIGQLIKVAEVVCQQIHAQITALQGI